MATIQARAAAIGFAAAWVLLLNADLGAQEHQHGAEQLGTVHFATSCTATAQTAFDRAMALLHSFEFSAAIDGFTAAANADATCAIPYWGIALARWSNPFA